MSIIFSPPTIDDSYFQKIDLDIIKNNFNVSCPEDFLNLLYINFQSSNNIIKLFMINNIYF